MPERPDRDHGFTSDLSGVQEKLRAAERERAVAEARAVEERRRRKLQVGLAAAVLALTIVGGLSITYYLQQRKARFAALARILGEATTLRDQARAHPDDPARWHEVLAATRRVEDPLGTGTGGDPETRSQSAALRGEAQAGMEGAERDRRLLDRLVDIRSAEADDLYGSGIGLATDAAYADAFKEAGIDLAALSPADAGQRIKARPPATALALAVALDDWAAVRRRRRSDRSGAKRLSDAATAAIPTPGAGISAALDQDDTSDRLAALQAAARSARFDERGAVVSLDLLGTALESSGDRATAETVLRAAQRRHPGDVWVNYDLGRVCEEQKEHDDALRFYTAARSIRPESAHQLAHLLERKGKSDEAIAVFRDLVRLRARNGYHLACLGSLLQKLGRPEEAAPILDASVAAGRESIRLKPNDARAHNHLGLALKAQGKRDEAIVEFRAAIRLKPDFANAHNNLGGILGESEPDFTGAIAELQEAIRLEPDDAAAHNNLGATLNAQGKRDEAIAEYRAAIRLNPDFAGYHLNLGNALNAQGKPEDALAAFRRAGALATPGSSLARDLPGRIRQMEQLIAMTDRLPAVLKGEDTPRDAAEGLAFGRLCYDQGRHAAAARLWAAALAADPKLGDDRQTRHRYSAACSAALAGSGRSRDDPPPGETTRAALRQQALDWLKAERAAWARHLEASPPQARPTIIQVLQHWQQDADLAGVREGAALAQLPEDEQVAWRDLWSDVESLLNRAQGDRP